LTAAHHNSAAGALSSKSGEHALQEITDWNVIQLFSPPVTPEYNGACEAGNGSVKTLTDHQAAHHGRPGQWSCDDIETARSAANIRTQQGIPIHDVLDHDAQAEIDRQAIRLALVEQAFLTIRRR
jgi:hypothetical protein